MPDSHAYIHAFSTLNVAKKEGHACPAKLLEHHNHSNGLFSNNQYVVPVIWEGP